MNKGDVEQPAPTYHQHKGINMKYLITTLLLMLSINTQAAGGKNQYNNPIFADDQCVATLPPGIDLDTCNTVPTDSGLIQYYCNTTIFILCPDNEPQAPGQDR